MDTAQDPAAWVDPFYGTRPGDADMGTGGGAGNTFPGADVPFGMVQWSPDTVTPQHGGYYYDDNRIKGFSLTHLSGPGCDTYQDIPFVPLAGEVTASPATEPGRYIATFSHANEHASPGRYDVRLDSGVLVELTATQRSGCGRFGYPADRPATLLVNVSGSVMGVDHAQVRIGPDFVEGSAASGRFCGTPSHYTVYFHARFDRPFRDKGTWSGGSVRRGGTSASGTRCGAYVGFDGGSTVTVRLGLSFVSIEGARANLDAECGTRDFDGIAAAARATWNEWLNRIRVSGGTDDQRRIFYTALYHALLQPNVFSDVDGRYLGFDEQIHTTDPARPIYTNFSGWDVYRGEVQLLALLAPREAADIARSMAVFAREGGAWDRWTVAADYTGVMNGDPYHIIVAAMYAFGATDFDAAEALSLMVEGATMPGRNRKGYEERPGLAEYLRLGYVPQQVSDTLEYTSADFAIAQLAERLGVTTVREAFLKRAQNWRNLFNPATGYLQPRRADGSFVEPFDPADPAGYVEGNGAQYLWMVPYNLGELIASLGGNEAVNARLDTFFTKLNAGTREPYAFLGNEPTMHTPWIYVYTGAAHRTQALVDRVRRELFRAAPENLVGNDDLGQMSAWYVWAALGMYPMYPGRAELVLNSPIFTSATVLRPDGVTITVTAPNAGPGRPYVTGLTVDGRPWTRPWLPESFVHTGGTLEFTLADSPDPSWGAAPQDAPPSFPAP
ncbi:GH92 family glycosyl hydrolase [Nocardia sp. CDC159]|uniref:GH92 family glycosyl hydrolase n=1 Tax=Nocardia pulmonis TaxID=2951408 RepID=A0A9X2IV73_9NOCA|nr:MULTISPECIES: GH92 family glycosyl hydrolase [Nocardia]MCM6773602.1 GH92 family glycosyl hydrolase [Nocardia pulmonis]MCM6786489.1 GH92 family glycosyl hydrolase [Nocardia sp. CDC159]